MKKAINKSLIFIIAFITLLSASAIPASAHHLLPWSQKYPSATSTDVFAIQSMQHIDGRTLKYYWKPNNDAKNERILNALNHLKPIQNNGIKNNRGCQQKILPIVKINAILKELI